MRSIIREQLLCGDAPDRLPRLISLLLTRAKLLDEPHQRLLQAVLARDMSAAEVGHLLDMPAWQVRYRVRSWCCHLAGRRFTQALKAMRHLPPEAAEVLRRHVLCRQPTRQVARQLGITLYQLRVHLAVAQGVMGRLARVRRAGSGETAATRAAPAPDRRPAVNWLVG